LGFVLTSAGIRILRVGTKGGIDRGGLEAAMNHAILALRIVALVAVIVPVGQLEIFLEGFHVAVLQEVTRLLPSEDVVGGTAPGRALEIEVSLEELEEQRGEVELPAFLGVLQDLLEERRGLVAMQELFLVRRLLIGIAGREHHALNFKFHHLVEELADVGRIGAGEKRGVGRHTEAALDRFLDRLDCGVVGAIAADRGVVLFLQAVHVHGEREVLGGLEKVELTLEEQGVRAKINILFALHEAGHDLVDFIMDQRFATRDADHRCAAFLHRVEALLGCQAFVENVGGILDLTATGAGEIAAEKRLQHEDERITLAALELLGDDVGSNCPRLRDRNHSFGLVKLMTL
jgi:hypothetical protein